MLREEQQWFRFSTEDLSMAGLALDNGIYNQACFHAQQAVEKMLKGSSMCPT